MLWPLIKDSVPFKAILLLVLILLLWWFNWYTAGTVLLLVIADIFFVNLWLSPHYNNDFVYSKDILKLFACDGTWLQVAMDRAKISDVKQLNLYQQDQLAYVDFNLNADMHVRYKFPLQQYQPFLEWLQSHLPRTQIVTSLKS